MKYKNLWRMTLSLALLISLILPTAGLANAKANAASLPAKSTGQKSEILVKYGQLAAKYLVDCDDLANQPRPSGERLKRCLTIAKELRDKFTEFTTLLETIIRNLESGNKWTKELDEQFLGEAARRGIDNETANAIKRARGVPAFLKLNLSDLKSSKDDFDREIKLLESKEKDTASAQFSFFQMASYQPAAEHNRARGLLKLAVKVAKAAAKVAAAVCTFTDFCD